MMANDTTIDAATGPAPGRPQAGPRPLEGSVDARVGRGAPLSPNQRAWARFKRNRLGYLSLWIFVVLLVLATLAELISNDRPLLARYDGKLYFPLIDNPPERQFGPPADPFLARGVERRGTTEHRVRPRVHALMQDR